MPGAPGIARADVFLTEQGPVLCELNCDTPSGEAEAVLLNRTVAPAFPDLCDPNCELGNRFCAMIAAVAARVGRLDPAAAAGAPQRAYAVPVDGLEAGARQEDLAADLELGGHVLAVQGQGHRADGPHVRRDVVAAEAVAAGHAAEETAVLVVQGHREAVEILGQFCDGDIHLRELEPVAANDADARHYRRRHA